jgi:hypothetical protein
MNRIKNCINQIKLKFLSELEEDPTSYFTELFIQNFLYSKKKSDLNESFNTIHRLDELLKKDIDYWINILKNYLNSNYVHIIGIPR